MEATNLLRHFRWVWTGMPGMPKVMQILGQLHLKNELSHKISFLHVIRDPQKLRIYSVISSGWGQAYSKD